MIQTLGLQRSRSEGLYQIRLCLVWGGRDQHSLSSAFDYGSFRDAFFGFTAKSGMLRERDRRCRVALTQQ